MFAAILLCCGGVQAQTKRSDDFRVEDAPSAVQAAARIIPINSARAYTVNGTQATDSTRGVVIEQGQKSIRR